MSNDASFPGAKPLEASTYVGRERVRGAVYPLSRPPELVKESHGFDHVVLRRVGAFTKAQCVTPANLYYGVVIRTKCAARRRYLLAKK